MDAVIEFFDTLVAGFGRTLALLGIAGVGALVLGTVVAGMRVSPVPPLRAVAAAYTEIFRNIPLTLVLFGCAFVLPFLGVRFPGMTPQESFFTLAAIGLTAYTAPFISEAVRSGINGIPVGQAEAARAIGLGFGQTLGLVILPQAVRMVIPPLTNRAIAITKMTALGTVIGVPDILNQATTAQSFSGNASPLTLAALAYVVLFLPFVILSRWLESRFAWKKG